MSGDFNPQDPLDVALAELAAPGGFAAIEGRIAELAPRLQEILNEALAAGGWFDEAHDGQVLKAATTPDEEERLRVVRTLLAEETRMGMIVGVAVGWELAKRMERLDRDG